jgi:hypothetical protein
VQLFHFSDEADIASFVPRPVRVPSTRGPGRDWLNGPLVWAIDDAHEFLYLFPRQCPRILIWAAPGSSDADKAHWLAGRRAVAFIEAGWLDALRTAEIQRYRLPFDGFESLDDAGMWVARQTVAPLGRERLTDLPAELAMRDVELRVLESLVPLRGLWDTSLHVSGIRLRNAAGWS